VPEHAITAGPMQDVVHNLAHVSDSDVHARCDGCAPAPVSPERVRAALAA